MFLCGKSIKKRNCRQPQDYKAVFFNHTYLMFPHLQTITNVKQNQEHNQYNYLLYLQIIVVFFFFFFTKLYTEICLMNIQAFIVLFMNIIFINICSRFEKQNHLQILKKNIKQVIYRMCQASHKN